MCVNPSGSTPQCEKVRPGRGFGRTGVLVPLRLQVLQIVAVGACLQQRQVSGQEARCPGGLLRRQAAQEAEAERQRPARERETAQTSRTVCLRPRARCRQPGARSTDGLLLPRLQVRLQAQQVSDGEAFGAESGAVQPGLIDPEPRG